MITYVDTSTLIKLIIDEPGSDAAEVIWDQADVLVAARLLYVEARAALAAARRGRRLTSGQHRGAVSSLDELWSQVSIVEITDDLVANAVDLVDAHRLRGYDAFHLAAALLVGADVLTSADRQLCDAAQMEGLHVANPIESAQDAALRSASASAVVAEITSVTAALGEPMRALDDRMTGDSGLYGIPVPGDAVERPRPNGGFLAREIGTIQQVTAFYKDRMSTDGWIFDATYSRLEPYQSEDERLGYITQSFYIKPTTPVTTVGIIVGNADGKPGHKRDLVIYITQTPDEDLPEAATRVICQHLAASHQWSSRVDRRRNRP